MSSAPQSGDVLTGGLVVGIGASAGGLAAFKTFLANTPAATQASDSGGHYLRTTNPLNAENLAVYPRRVGTNRPNPSAAMGKRSVRSRSICWTTVLDPGESQWRSSWRSPTA